MDRYIGLKLDGRYEITELIGVGGMANVYRGRDIMENRVVAVKILKSEYSENEEFVRRFRNESKAIAVLSHPNIVKIYDVGYENDMQYIVMEYIDGITLREYIEQQGMLKWRDCVHFTIQILRALQLAHDRGIVHRDIKPQNVMLLSDGSIKVMDFGIARFSREVENTDSEKTMGSVHYVSPEQASGGRTDERSDIYSVGVMMYEMLTGRKPFNGDTPVSVALKHMHDAPVPPTQYVSSIYPGLEEIILHAMEKDPSKRYQSASGMIRDIEAFKLDQSITFGYLDKNSDGSKEQDQSGAKVKFAAALSAIKPAKKEKPKKEKRVKVEEPEPVREAEYYEEEYYDDDEIVVRHNYALPILAAVTVTVIIVATLFVANVILGAFKTAPSNSNEYPMPQLIGLNFYDARAQYTDIQLVATEEYNNDYPSGVIFYQEKAEGRMVTIGDTIRVTVSKGTRMVSIPDLRNYHISSAIKALEDVGLGYVQVQQESDDIAADYVVRTDPEANTSVEEGTIVKIFISLGPMTEDTIVPYVVGKDINAASSEIEAAHLTVKPQYITSSEPRDTVVSQNIEGGSNVARDTVITIMVSDGSGEVPEETYDFPEYEDEPVEDFPSGSETEEPGNIPEGGTPEAQPVEHTVTIYVDIPADAQNTYFLNFCYQGTQTQIGNHYLVGAAQWAGSGYPVQLTGSGVLTVDAYIRYGVTVRLATYVIDFDNMSYYCEDYSDSAFRTVDNFANF